MIALVLSFIEGDRTMDQQRGDPAKNGPESGRMPSVAPARVLVPFLDARPALALAGCVPPGVLRTIPYSEFKAALGRGEVSECTIEEDEITGKVTPKPATATAQPGARQAASPADAVLIPERPRRGSQARRGPSEGGGRVQRRAPGGPVAIPLGLAAADRRDRAALVGAVAPARGRGRDGSRLRQEPGAADRRESRPA